MTEAETERGIKIIKFGKEQSSNSRKLLPTSVGICEASLSVFDLLSTNNTNQTLDRQTETLK